MLTDDSLRHLRIIVAIDEEGSLAAASRKLGLSLPSISRILSQSEANIGARLFERTARRCVSTEVGSIVLERSRQILADYTEMFEIAGGSWREPKGLVRMTAPVTFGRLHVVPSLCRFLDANPAIDVALHLTDAVVDLTDAGFDVGLRIGPVTSPSLVAKRVGEVAWWTLASRDYLDRHGTPASPADLGGHKWIQHSSILQPARSPQDLFGPQTATPSTRLAVNDAMAALEAARRGMGILSALSYQAQKDVDEGRLVRIRFPGEAEPIPVSLVYPETRRRIERSRRLVDFLAEDFGKLLRS
ncbi:Transcriptional regulator [Pelagerythrobacter marensis]|uniref:Transcriptional regulator n=1 Tax=Pelagerythrobacter marensis TaxID=543877 RepID=A0A0G3XBV6_9SPHN|nr:Transcriptional regulator [Pelagerythrobacter marensis]